MRRPADGGRRRRLPSAPSPPTARSRRPARASAPGARADRGRAQRPWRPHGAPARRSSASPPSTAAGAIEYGRGKLRRRVSTRWWSTTSRARDIGFDADSNEVTILTADGEQHVPRASKTAHRRVRFCDAADRLEGGPGAWPLRSWAPPNNPYSRRHGERLRPLPPRLRAAAPRRPPGRDRAAHARARKLEPDKASIREALGRALFHAQRYEDAAAEFEAIAAQAPTNDYALFCLGRAMQQLGRHAEAATRWRWPARCAPSAATTASTGTARGAPRRPHETPRTTRRRRCYARPTAFVSAVQPAPAVGTESGRPPAFMFSRPIEGGPR